MAFARNKKQYENRGSNPPPASGQKKKPSYWPVYLILVLGICIMLYPTVSSFLASLEHEDMVQSYSEDLEAVSQEDAAAMMEAARAYNEGLINGTIQPGSENYVSLLRLGEVMGVLKIPCIDVDLPIYHGTSEAVLQHGIGHWEKSSLPTGGKGNHTVLSGHRGLPNSVLLTHLDKVKEGDYFFITILDQVLAYQVTEILIVDPNIYDERAMQLDPERDLATLMTCTPYGVNTHRLLVTGERTENYDPTLLEEKKEEPETVPQQDESEEDSLQYYVGSPSLSTIVPENDAHSDRALALLIALIILVGSLAVDLLKRLLRRF